MAAIPLVQTADRTINQLQQNIKQAIDPVIANPLATGLLVKNIPLISGTTVVSVGLGRTVQGWIVVDRTNDALIHRDSTAPLNNKTLTLISDVASVVALYVF